MRLTVFEKLTMTAALIIVVGMFFWAAGARSFEESPAVSETVIRLAVDDLTVQEADKGLININTAIAEQLLTLNGIGEELAQRIVEYRDEHGPFEDIYDLMNVSGIGAKKLEAIADKITVG